MSPTLLILAAGLGSRYGGLKQVEHFGPRGETLIDYAVFDALAAGFAKVVFVVRRDIAADFRAVVGSKYEKRMAVDYAFQERDDLPSGFRPPPDRKKPWGTAHAIWCARHRVSEPFASINADDYYGKSVFAAVAAHLRRRSTSASLPEYCMVGYPILRTLPERGAVARAICQVAPDGFLQALVERGRVERSGDSAQYVDEEGQTHTLTGDEVVSMNVFGLTPAVFDQIERELIAFLTARELDSKDTECLIPVVVDHIVKARAARMRVLPTSESWFGVTHAADKPRVVQAIARMIERGEYPSPLWPEG